MEDRDRTETMQHLAGLAHEAAGRGDIDEMEDLLTNTAYRPNTKYFYEGVGSMNYITALYQACIFERDEVIAYLLWKGFDPYFKVFYGGRETSAAQKVAMTFYELQVESLNGAYAMTLINSNPDKFDTCPMPQLRDRCSNANEVLASYRFNPRHPRQAPLVFAINKGYYWGVRYLVERRGANLIEQLTCYGALGLLESRCRQIFKTGDLYTLNIDRLQLNLSPFIGIVIFLLSRDRTLDLGRLLSYFPAAMQLVQKNWRIMVDDPLAKAQHFFEVAHALRHGSFPQTLSMLETTGHFLPRSQCSTRPDDR